MSPDGVELIVKSLKNNIVKYKSIYDRETLGHPGSTIIILEEGDEEYTRQGETEMNVRDSHSWPYLFAKL